MSTVQNGDKELHNRLLDLSKRYSYQFATEGSQLWADMWTDIEQTAGDYGQDKYNQAVTRETSLINSILDAALAELGDEEVEIFPQVNMLEKERLYGSQDGRNKLRADFRAAIEKVRSELTGDK